MLKLEIFPRKTKPKCSISKEWKRPPCKFSMRFECDLSEDSISILQYNVSQQIFISNIFFWFIFLPRGFEN